MNKLRNSWIIFIIILIITTFNSDISNIRLITVQGVIEPSIESEIVIGIDLGHDNTVNYTDIVNFTSILDSTFDSEGVKLITTELSSEILTDIDVLMVLAPTIAYSESEVEAVEQFIKEGNSILIATGFRNQSNEPCNDIMNSFGLKFDLTSSIIPENAHVIPSAQYSTSSKNFTAPEIPITEDITQIVLPNGLGISFNDSKLTSYQSPSITFYNPILLLNQNETPSGNNTLVSSLEFNNGARILAISSSDMFNNSYIEPLPSNSSIFNDNTDFLLNAIKWLGRNTGIMNFYHSSVDKVVGQAISIGEMIFGNVTLVDSQNRSLSQGQVVIALERDGLILSQRSMSVDPNNFSNYKGWVSTEGVSYGHCDVLFIANLKGYHPLELSASRVYISRLFPSPILPNLAFWGLTFASILIFLSIALFIRTSLKKYE